MPCLVAGARTDRLEKDPRVTIPKYDPPALHSLDEGSKQVAINAYALHTRAAGIRPPNVCFEVIKVWSLQHVEKSRHSY